MELEGLLLCSKEPATGCYPDPDESSAEPQIQFVSDTFQCCPHIYSRIFQMVSIMRLCNQNFVSISLRSHAFYMSHQSHPP
jgi:hypothetical protein